MRVVDASEKTVFGRTTILAASEFGEKRSTELKVHLPLQPLAPGEYLLTMEGTREEDTSRGDVRFIVR